jgi:hypothetical protein
MEVHRDKGLWQRSQLAGIPRSGDSVACWKRKSVPGSLHVSFEDFTPMLSTASSMKGFVHAASTYTQAIRQNIPFLEEGFDGRVGCHARILGSVGID